MLRVLILTLLGASVGRPATLSGHVFREADGSPPRRPLTIELSQKGKVKYRRTTAADGAFQFPRVAAGRYFITPRFRDFAFVQDLVIVSGDGPNFTAIMLPRRRAGTAQFGTVSVDQLASRTPRAVKKLKEAGRRVAAGDLSGAVERYEQVLASSPSAELYDAVALLYLRQNRKEQAYQAFEKAIAQDPKFLFSYSHLASVYAEDGRYKELAEVAARALQIEPRWATAHLQLGEAQLRLGDLESAAQHARTAAGLVQDKAPDPHLLLAKVGWKRHDCSQVREHIHRYLALYTTGRELSEGRQVLAALESCAPR
ncbi:MAG: tetratricopeptide repeat protein [Acidobacteria bacterium]|nr:tetratricopeptide repeat protein [Acidobacteriota bacterium]